MGLELDFEGTGAEAGAAPPRALVPVPQRPFSHIVLAARHLWLLGTAPPDHAQLWHQALPDPKTELELGELFPGEQTPGDRSC